jgi:hypothetical protein
MYLRCAGVPLENIIKHFNIPLINFPLPFCPFHCFLGHFLVFSSFCRVSFSQKSSVNKHSLHLLAVHGSLLHHFL